MSWLDVFRSSRCVDGRRAHSPSFMKALPGQPVSQLCAHSFLIFLREKRFVTKHQSINANGEEGGGGAVCGLGLGRTGRSVRARAGPELALAMSRWPGHGDS